MNKAKILTLLIFFSANFFNAFSQNPFEEKFFSTVPQLMSGYPSPGNPCYNSIEFSINSNETNTISMKAGIITKDAKGKANINFSEGGNKTVWYKLIFKTDCELSFRIYADRTEDIYHYFVYRQNDDPGFCQLLSEKKVVPIRANMLEHKEGIIGTGITEGIKINYSDSTDFYFKRILHHTPFLDGIMGKAGETYYINIYNVGGADAFHYLVLSACYREINLKTQNDNVSIEKAKIIEKLPEYVTKPPIEKTQAEKDSLAALEKMKLAKAKEDAESKKRAESLAKVEAEAKKKAAEDDRKNSAAKAKAEEEARKKAERDASEKAKAEEAEKRINDAKAKQKAAEELKKKSSIKKRNPQLVSIDEIDTLHQFLVEGEIKYQSGKGDPVVNTEIYIVNSEEKFPIVKKMYTNEKGKFRFANLPGEQNYILSLNADDPNLIKGNEPQLNGILTYNGNPSIGVLINNIIKTDSSGRFILSGKDLYPLDVNNLFNRWTVDLSDPATYAEILKKYGGVSIEGLVYRVQIGAYREEENFNYNFMNDLGKVDKQSLPDGITRFVMGEFTTLIEADAFKKKAFERKVNDAFILAYLNGNKKFLEELIEKGFLGKK